MVGLARRRGLAFLLILPLERRPAAATVVPENELRLTPWVQDPVAQHTSCPVRPNTPTVCTLAGVIRVQTVQGAPLLFFLHSLPEEGLLYETSPNFRTYGSDPKHMPDPIGPHLLPFLVTDPLHRIVYVPPTNKWAPEGSWATFTYRVQENVTRFVVSPSEVGQVVLASPDGSVAGTNFDLASDGGGWSISGNLADAHATSGGLRHQAITWGDLSNYVYGVDEVQFNDFATGFDRSKWYFEASSSFHGTKMAAAYGGRLRFTLRSLYGNFTELNSPLDWITIECASCDSGRGARMIRFVDQHLRWDGAERTVEVEFSPYGLWMRDPLNSALDFAYASRCEIASILSDVSRLAILGDFTKAGEGVAIDDVAVIMADPSVQPAFPDECQRGCFCRHNENLIRPTCC